MFTLPPSFTACAPSLTVCLGLLASRSLAAAPSVGAKPDDEPAVETTWHARLGVGWNPVLDSNDRLPTADAGFGGTLSGFYQLPHRLSVGAGFDRERYTYDTSLTASAANTPPRYVDLDLYVNRLQVLAQWDLLPRNFVTPFLVLGAGYHWQQAEVTDWQCRPKQQTGPVVGAGLGLEMTLGSGLGLGFEYRTNTPPLSARTCTLAYVPDEPLGAPTVTSHRFGLTFGVRR